MAVFLTSHDEIRSLRHHGIAVTSSQSYFAFGTGYVSRDKAIPELKVSKYNFRAHLQACSVRCLKSLEPDP